MIKRMISYFKECLDDLRYDTVNNIGISLIHDESDSHIRRYSMYISLLGFIDKNITNTICLPMIGKLIIEFNKQLEVKNNRLDSGIYDDNELLIEYIQSNINRYDSFISELNKFKHQLN